MYTRLQIMTLGLGVLVSVAAWGRDAFEVAIGDDLAAVRAALGEPQGYLLSGERSLLTYARGKVELRDGKVTGVDLVSAEVAARRKQQEQADRLASQVRRQEAGERLRDTKLDDPEFLFLPATGQFAFWRAFRQQYPAVDLTAVGLPELAVRASTEAQVATVQAAAEAQSRKQADMMALEWRVQEAEARADEAALAARRAATRSGSSGFYGGWTSTRWPTTVVIGGYPPSCPPVAVPYRSPRGVRAATVQSHGRAVFGGFSSGATFHRSSSGASFFPTQKR